MYAFNRIKNKEEGRTKERIDKNPLSYNPCNYHKEKSSHCSFVVSISNQSHKRDLSSLINELTTNIPFDVEL